MPTTAQTYICGGNERIDSRSCYGRGTVTPPTGVQYEYGPLRSYIFNRDLGYRFELEPATRIYTAFQISGVSPIQKKPAPSEFKKTGKTIHDHTETIDTGERKEMFGYPARRVLKRTRQTRDSQLLTESESDGWHIDAPAAWRNLHPLPSPGVFYRLSIGNGEREDHKSTQTGQRETGFLVRATRIEKSYYMDEAGNTRSHESVHRDEVTELSEAPLEPDLFVPPADFKRVAQLPDGVHYRLAYRMRLRWEMFRDTRSLPARIAQFTT